MKKLVFTFMVLMVVFQATAGAEPVKLRYKFSVGDRMEYVMNATAEGKIEFSQAGERITGMPSSLPLDMDLYMSSATEVMAVDGDGLATLEILIKRYVISQAGNTIVNYDSEEDGDWKEPGMSEYLGEPLVMVVDPLGGIREMKGLEKLSKLSPQMDLAGLVGQMHQQFPEKAVDVGDAWTQEIPLRAGGAGGDGKVVANMEFTGYEMIKGLNCAKINSSFDGDVSALMETFMKNMPMAKDMDVRKVYMKAVADVFFEPEAGVFIASEFSLDQDMLMTVSTPGRETPKPVTLKMSMKVKGVFELE